MPLLSLDCIIKKKKIKGYKSLIVGENISRYLISNRYWISIGRKGINYKSSKHYSGPKILVRKTGVGISAALDYTNSLTNQVVYIFKTKSQIPIEAILAILNSRVTYYYLVKKHGETEWRSHPYLTQNQILDLPFPNLETIPSSAKITKITKLIKPNLMRGRELPNKIDAKIEFLVATLYGLSKKDYHYVYETINNSEELLPVKKLKNISIEDIFC